MILRFGRFCQLNEMVKNEKRAAALAGEICRKAMDICPSCSAESNMRQASMLVSISNIDRRDIAAIESMLSRMKPEMEKQDLILSWSENAAAPASMRAQIVAHIKSARTIRVKPPRYVYHYTDADVESILDKGLAPMPSSSSDRWSKNAALEYPAAIFAIADDETMWGGRSLLEIDTKGLANKWWRDLNFSVGPAIMTFDPIPASHIRKISESERKSRSMARKAGIKSGEEAARAEESAFVDAIQKGTASYEGKDPACAGFRVASAIASIGGKEALEWYFSCHRTEREAQSVANMAAAAGNQEAVDFACSLFPGVDKEKAAKWAAMSSKNRQVRG